MPEPVSAISIYLIPGMTAKLKMAVSSQNDNGFAALPGSAPASYFPNKDTAALILKDGFIVEDTTIGTIEVHSENSLSVIYKHKKPYANAIWWFGFYGERALVNIITVPIHDHSNIVHGGPAYGTYFDDDVER